MLEKMRKEICVTLKGMYTRKYGYWLFLILIKIDPLIPFKDLQQLSLHIIYKSWVIQKQNKTYYS